MGGTIEVQSTPGDGSTFSFTVMMALDRDGKGEPHPGPPAQERPTPAEAAAPDLLTGSRVLVVEDSDLSRDVVVSFLEAAGVGVETAANGAIALERVTGSELGGYDAVLMDIQMPIMDGYEANSAVGGRPRTRRSACGFAPAHHRPNRPCPGRGEGKMPGGRHGRLSGQTRRRSGAPQGAAQVVGAGQGHGGHLDTAKGRSAAPPPVEPRSSMSRPLNAWAEEERFTRRH